MKNSRLKTSLVLSLSLTAAAVSSVLFSSCDSSGGSASPLTAVTTPTTPTTPTMITGVTATSSGSDFYPASRLVGNDGLSENSLTATHGDEQSHHWAIYEPSTVDLTFALGKAYNLVNTYIWQQNSQYSKRDIKKFNILTSTDGTTFTPVLSDQTLRRGLPTERDDVTPTARMSADVFSTQLAGVTHVRIQITESYDTRAKFLAKVRFKGSPVTP